MAQAEPCSTCHRPTARVFRRGLCVTCYRHARRNRTITLTELRPSTDVAEDVEWMLDTGETHPEAIASRIGYHGPTATDSLRRALRRADRPDLIARMTRITTKDEKPQCIPKLRLFS